MKKYLVPATFALILAVILAVFLVPFRTVLVPRWRLQVVDENGKPYKDQRVDQFCSNYTLEVDLCLTSDSTQYSDENGYVDFPERSFSMNLVSRILVSLKSYLMTLAHGSVGTRIRVNSIDYPAGSAKLEYDPETGPPSERWVIPRPDIIH